MSVVDMIVCRRCERTAKRAFRLTAVHIALLVMMALNTFLLLYGSYKLFGSELACVPPADFLDRLKEEPDGKETDVFPTHARRNL